MALKIKSEPGEEPVTVSEVKASPSLRVASAADDADIETLITTARITAEVLTWRVFVTQTWELVLDGFPSGGILIPFPPLQSIESVKYLDGAGVEQTLDAADYSVDNDSEPGMIVPAYGLVWPTTRDEVNAVRIRFVAGYGAAAVVPEAIKTWIKMRVGTLYDNPQGIIVGQTVANMPRNFVDGLLDPYRVFSFR